MRPAFGDRLGAMNLVAGVSGALVRKARTGEGAMVEVSLLGTAMWQIAHDIVYSLALGVENSRIRRGRNPLSGYYQTKDGRWLTVALLESDRWWHDFARAVGIEHLVEDARFHDHGARDANYEECSEILAEVFRSKTLDDWRRQLAGFNGPWEPMQSIQDLASDPQVIANEYLVETVTSNGWKVKNIPAPIKYEGAPGRLDGCPEPGAHTEEVLLELGESWDDILRHKEAGYIT
jgi:crotonobetainyl-CoA:carnitine CoA-transferase CaiB-like acyl-CoA transferase